MANEMSKKISFVLPLNELSGSCVSALKLANLLKSRGYDVSILCPSGDYIKPDKIIPILDFNFFHTLKTFFLIRKHLNQSDFNIFFTVRSAPLATLFGRSSFIYLHEVDVRPKFLFNIVSRFIKSYFINKSVVNTEMEQIYGKSTLLVNFLDFNTSNESVNKDIDFVMVSNCTVKKGVLEFTSLARSMPDKKFCFLTVNSANNSDLLNNISRNAASNLIVVTDQERKNEIIKKSKFLLNLSHLNETFGLTMLEAVALGTLPLSYDNIGSNFFFQNKKYILNKEDLLKSLTEKQKLLSDDYSTNLKCLQNMARNRFSSDALFSSFSKVVADINQSNIGA